MNARTENEAGAEREARTENEASAEQKASARRALHPLLQRTLAASLCLPLSLMTGCAAETGASVTPELSVRRGELRQHLVLAGELRAVHEQALLVPREAAWRHPIRWMEEHGARVKEGQRVLEFDNQALVSSLQEAELRRAQALNDLAAQEATLSGQAAEKYLELERKRAERDKAALQAAVPEQLLPEREWQQRRLALRRAEVEVAKAENDRAAQATAAEADLANKRLAYERANRDVASAERSLALLELDAPAAGILLLGEHPWEGRKIAVGDTVFAGWPVLSIPDLSEMKVLAGLSDVDDGRVLVGMPARCTLDARPEHVFTGRVVEVAPIAAEISQRSLRRAFRVEVELDASDPEIMIPGMSVRVEIETWREESALLAPRAALLEDPPRARLRDGELRELRLGACNAQDCVVLEGLAEGALLAPGGDDA